MEMSFRLLHAVVFVHIQYRCRLICLDRLSEALYKPINAPGGRNKCSNYIMKLNINVIIADWVAAQLIRLTSQNTQLYHKHWTDTGDLLSIYDIWVHYLLHLTHTCRRNTNFPSFWVPFASRVRIDCALLQVALYTITY